MPLGGPGPGLDVRSAQWTWRATGHRSLLLNRSGEVANPLPSPKTLSARSPTRGQAGDRCLRLQASRLRVDVPSLPCPQRHKSPGSGLLGCEETAGWPSVALSPWPLGDTPICVNAATLGAWPVGPCIVAGAQAAWGRPTLCPAPPSYTGGQVGAITAMGRTHLSRRVRWSLPCGGMPPTFRGLRPELPEAAACLKPPPRPQLGLTSQMGVASAGGFVPRCQRHPPGGTITTKATTEPRFQVSLRVHPCHCLEGL